MTSYEFWLAGQEEARFEDEWVEYDPQEREEEVDDDSEG
jgi:hypothetical protein